MMAAKRPVGKLTVTSTSASTAASPSPKRRQRSVACTIAADSPSAAVSSNELVGMADTVRALAHRVIVAQVEMLSPPVGGAGPHSYTCEPMRRPARRHIVCSDQMFALRRWLTGRWHAADTGDCGEAPTAPAEAIALRCLALVLLVVCVIATVLITPHPALHGKGLVTLAGLVVMLASAVAAQVEGADAPTRRVLLALLGVTAGAIALAVAQPSGIWSAGIYYVAIIAAMRFDRWLGTLVLICALVPFMVGAAVEGSVPKALFLPVGVIPWFLVMRLLREVHIQRAQLHASRTAEADAAAAAERGRLAREMHDVLAHSLSALALQLESTRLLARERRRTPCSTLRDYPRVSQCVRVDSDDARDHRRRKQ